MRAAFILVTASLLPGCAAHRCERSLGPEDAAELLALAEADQAARSALVQWSREHPGRMVPPALVRGVTEADERSRSYLRDLVEAHCWPRASEVGPEAAHAAWLLAQHADTDLDLQLRVLELMEPLVAEGEAAAGDLALLTDRVLVAQGLPQRYGTQYRSESIGGVLRFRPATPIEDPEGIDERRAAAGLPPLAEYEATLREAYGIPADAPTLPPPSRD